MAKRKKQVPKFNAASCMDAIELANAVIENQTKLAHKLIELGIPLDKMKDLHELQSDLFHDWFLNSPPTPSPSAKKKFIYKK